MNRKDMDILDAVVELSHFFGSSPDIVQGGGGNTSVKIGDEKMWVKASGVPLRSVTRNDFIAVSVREAISILTDAGGLGSNTDSRDAALKKKIAKLVPAGTSRRPSIEIFLHALLGTYVVHLHPVYVNALTCMKDGRATAERVFKGAMNYLWVSYGSPGYPLGLLVRNGIKGHEATCGRLPDIVFLQNHGLIISCHNAEDVRLLYEKVIADLKAFFGDIPFADAVAGNDSRYAAVISKAYGSASTRRIELAQLNSPLFKSMLCSSRAELRNIMKPLFPDDIVYCGEAPLIIRADVTYVQLKPLLANFIHKYGYAPKVIIFEGSAIVLSGQSATENKAIREVLEAHIKVLHLINKNNVSVCLPGSEAAYIGRWESEKYRRQLMACGDRSRKGL